MELDEDDAAHFEFFLAEKLGRTVEELGDMSNAEFVRWGVYFGIKAQREELAQKQGG